MLENEIDRELGIDIGNRDEFEKSVIDSEHDNKS